MRSLLQIGNHLVGAGHPALLCAELGVNHNGSLSLAREMVHAAAEAGADAVKFQAYQVEDFLLDRTLTYEYDDAGGHHTESQWEMFKRCELSWDALAELQAECDRLGVMFHATPSSPEGVRLLAEMGAACLKNGSDYLTRLDVIEAMGRTGLPTVISTGMGTDAEVDQAYRAFRDTRNDKLILLHCVSRYPTLLEEAGIGRIVQLQERHQCLVGYSDHTEGVYAAVAAVALGACWVEKHFTVDKQGQGPDHRFSADPAEFREMRDAIRGTEAAMRHTMVDEDMRLVARLSCAAGRDLPAGHSLSLSDIAFSRPGTGFAPGAAYHLVGLTLKCPLKCGQVFNTDHF